MSLKTSTRSLFCQFGPIEMQVARSRHPTEQTKIPPHWRIPCFTAASRVRTKRNKIHGLEAGVALTRLNDQIVAYAKSLWPFNQMSVSRDNIVQYWANLMEHNDADVLAVRHSQIWTEVITCTYYCLAQYFATKLFDISVNSMADERTASTMSWLNTALRNSQKSSTLINQIQILLWVLNSASLVCSFLLLWQHFLFVF